MSAATLAIKIVTDARQAQAGFKDTEKSAGRFKSKIGVAGKVAAGVLGLVGVAAIGAGKAAAEDAQQQAILAQAMQKNTGASAKQIAANEEWISSMAAATGVADDQLRPALGDLVRATGSVTKSQDALKVAMDVAAATGQPLEAVTAAIAKGYGGNTKALGKLVPGIDKATVKAGDMTAIMAELAKKTGGAAATAANTAAGKMQRATLAMDEAKESIGAGLIPVLGILATGLAAVGAFAQKHAGIMQVIAVVIAVVALAVIALNAAVTVYTAVTTLAGSATLAAWAAALWPILAVVAVVALVSAAVVLLWKRSATFRRIVLAVWAAVKAGAKSAATVITAVFRVAWALISTYVRAYLAVVRVVMSIIWAVIRAAVALISAVWRALWGPLSAAARAYGTALAAVASSIRTQVTKAADWIASKWSALWASLTRAAAAAKSALTAPFDAVADAVANAIDWVQRLLTKISSIKLPKIPGLSSIVGAVTVAPAGPVPTARAVGGSVPVGSAAGSMVINVYGVLDGADAGRKIRQVLRTDDRRRTGVRIVGA